MTVIYVLPFEMRRRLKAPLGTLIRGSFIETMKKLRDMTENEKSPCVISVGDTVSKNLIKNHMHPKLSVIDNRVMRKNIEPIPITADETLKVKNPAGTITEEAITAIRDALRSNHRVKLVVEGEEDLLTLIAILYAPENSLVVYGQPREGIVVVKVTAQKKAEIEEILKSMEIARKS